VLDGPRGETGSTRDIAAVYASPEVLTGSLATRDRFLKSAVGRRVVHLSAATTANSAYPLLSRVMLADEPGRPNSGALLGRDIAATPLTDTELVVIDQRAGATRSESNELGLSRAFIAAGVPAVLTTLPGADEIAAAEQFVGFHREVANGAAAVDALSRLQRNAIKQNGRRLGAWFALVIYGSDR
jgi:CHAT domain-containing protein